MNEIVNILNIPSTFLLFLAPPAWGKTSLLLKLYENEEIKIVYLSPLRAIAEEFFSRFQNKKHVYKLNKKKECKEVICKFTKAKKAFLITTCELLDDEIIGHLSSDDPNTFFIFDEFHLFYYWGEGFREKMWETYLGICNTGASILGLSATVDDLILKKMKGDIKLGMDHFYLLSLGNQQLKKMPFNNHFFGFKKIFVRRFLYEVSTNPDSTFLFFCRYRASVDYWVNYFIRKKINVLGCVGGMAQEFVLALKDNPKPRCIFATSVLGHGVNLPSIDKIFIDYEEINKDFYIQMVGRGGRSGENFELYSFNKNLFESKKKQWISFIKAIIFDIFYLKYRINFWRENGKQNRGTTHSQSNSGRQKYCFQITSSKWKSGFSDFLWRPRRRKKNEAQCIRAGIHAQG